MTNYKPEDFLYINKRYKNYEISVCGGIKGKTFILDSSTPLRKLLEVRNNIISNLNAKPHPIFMKPKKTKLSYKYYKDLNITLPVGFYIDRSQSKLVVKYCINDYSKIKESGVLFKFRYKTITSSIDNIEKDIKHHISIKEENLIDYNKIVRNYNSLMWDRFIYLLRKEEKTLKPKLKKVKQNKSSIDRELLTIAVKRTQKNED
jgi:hypothetical protein